MKKFFLSKKFQVIAILFALAGSYTSNIALASTSVFPELKVYIDEKELNFTDAKPYINESGRTMVPIRAISESFGAKVDWNDTLKMVVITHDNIEITFKIDYVENVLNISDLESNQNKSITMDSKPVIINGRTFVPYRSISEAFGYEVNWNANEYKINIDTTTKKPVFPINPALSDTFYQSIDNLNTNFENLIFDLKSPDITYILTDEKRQYLISEAKSHVEDIVGNVDYSKKFDPYYPDAPFTSIMKDVYNNAVENSIIREVKFIADTSNVEVLRVAEIFELTPVDSVVIGRLEFIYYEASDEYLNRFEGKLKEGVWYSTKIAVKLIWSKGFFEVEEVFLDNEFEEIS